MNRCTGRRTIDTARLGPITTACATADGPIVDRTRWVRLVLGRDVDSTTAHYWRAGDPCGHVTSRCDDHADRDLVCLTCTPRP